MRELILHMLVTVDGFSADQHGWVGPESQWDEEVQQFYLDLFTNADAVVFGRGLFEQYFGHWVKVANGEIPPHSNVELLWTRRLRDMQKYVVSRTLSNLADRSSVINGDITAKISKLKMEPGGNLLLMCGASLYAQLTAKHLIDEICYTSAQA